MHETLPWTSAISRSERERAGATAPVRAFTREPELWLAVAPEGTRSKTDHWKSGFYHAALAANVPVLLAFIDTRTRQCGLGELIELSGDPDRDLARIRGFYSGKRGIRPALPARFAFTTVSPDDGAFFDSSGNTTGLWHGSCWTDPS